jgi:hypothetical protein
VFRRTEVWSDSPHLQAQHVTDIPQGPDRKAALSAKSSYPAKLWKKCLLNTADVQQGLFRAYIRSKNYEKPDTRDSTDIRYEMEQKGKLIKKVGRVHYFLSHDLRDGHPVDSFLLAYVEEFNSKYIPSGKQSHPTDANSGNYGTTPMNLSSVAVTVAYALLLHNICTNGCDMAYVSSTNCEALANRVADQLQNGTKPTFAMQVSFLFVSSGVQLRNYYDNELVG